MKLLILPLVSAACRGDAPEESASFSTKGCMCTQLFPSSCESDLEDSLTDKHPDSFSLLKAMDEEKQEKKLPVHLNGYTLDRSLSQTVSGFKYGDIQRQKPTGQISVGIQDPPPGLKKNIPPTTHENYVTEGDFEIVLSKRSRSEPQASPNLLLPLLLLWLSPLFSRDHMFANGPPGWEVQRLESSLVDPPISPGPQPRRSGARPLAQRAPRRPQSFLLTGDRQRWVEERRREERRERGTCQALQLQLGGEETSSRMKKLLKKSHLSLQAHNNIDVYRRENSGFQHLLLGLGAFFIRENSDISERVS
ncbi:hypothetical protein Q8A73_011196 [Channa argus]|nr:hypothetical protein Q8A73_011196 [Channa argus]